MASNSVNIKIKVIMRLKMLSEAITADEHNQTFIVVSTWQLNCKYAF